MSLDPKMFIPMVLFRLSVFFCEHDLRKRIREAFEGICLKLITLCNSRIKIGHL
jgi:hypothetical protein